MFLTKSSPLPCSYRNNKRILKIDRNQSLSKYSSIAATVEEGNEKPPKPYKNIPTVEGVPILRGIKAAKSVSGIGGLEYAKKYGNMIRFEIGTKKFVALFAPEYAKEYMGHDQALPEGLASTFWFVKYQAAIFNEIERPSNILLSGPKWKAAREYFQGLMFPPKESQFYFPHIDRCAVAVVDRFENVETQQELQDTLIKTSFELFHGFMYGKPSGIFEKDCDPEYLNLLYASKAWMTAMGHIGGSGKMEWMKHFDPFLKKNLKVIKDNTIESQRAWDDLGEKRITEMMQEKDELALTSYIAKLGRTTDDLQRAVRSTGGFLSAAVDTTSATLTWLLYHTAKNQDKQEELFQQIDKAFNGRGLESQDDVEKAPLLAGFIKESQRLNPLSAGTMRTYNKAVVINGYEIPAGTTVFVSPSNVTGRNPDIYESPLSFKPERWTPEARSLRRKNKTAFPHDSPFSVMQFSIGPRMCLGARIAQVELLCILQRLVQHYKIDFAEGSVIPTMDIMSTEHGLMLPDPYPLLKFTRRT